MQDHNANELIASVVSNSDNVTEHGFTGGSSSTSIAELFGYFEYSDSNIMVLLHKVSLFCILHGYLPSRHHAALWVLFSINHAM